MSIPIVKQNVSGPPLPVGDTIAYAKDIQTHQWKQFQCGLDRYVTYQELYPFPPYENTQVYNTLFRLTMPADMLVPETNYAYAISYFRVANFDLQRILNLEEITCAFSARSIVSGRYNDFFTTYIRLNSGAGNTFKIVENAYPMNVFSLFENVFVAGLGCSYGGAPYFYIHIGTYTDASDMTIVPVNEAACIVNAYYEVSAFGAASTVTKNSTNSKYFADLSGYIYVLLNNVTGVALEFKAPNKTWKYVTFTIPSGGKIKQFADGFYVASNSLGEHFLYSINNNGTLIDKLDIGTCNIDNPLEIFAVA